MKIEVILPRFAIPASASCECLCKEMDLEYKTVILKWLVKTGSRVDKGDILCEAEMEKCVFEIQAPVEGILSDKCVSDGGDCGARQTIGYIETLPA